MTGTKPTKDEEARIALMAMDASARMNREHIRSGILPPESARNFDMQAAIAAVDQLRASGEVVIFCDPRDELIQRKEEEN